jgi:hypothetical protein
MQMKAEYSMKDQYREPFTKVEISFNNDKSKALKYKAILNGLTLHMKGKYSYFKSESPR